MKKMLFVILFLCSDIIHAQGISLIDEYKLLHTDLLNLHTRGYKSFYNNEHNRGEEAISLLQGSLQMTDVNLDCAIVGEGFFKIRLEDESAGYTRAGAFLVNGDGIIITRQGYTLFDTISFEDNSLYEYLRITRDGSVYITQYDGEGKTTETKAGQLLLYKVPAELLKHYKDAIYVIKDDAEYIEEVISDTHIVQGALEWSNYPLLPVVLRMYYILSVLNKKEMPNLAFKKKLLKVQIDKMAQNDGKRKDYYLMSILPFMGYDY
jgi:flagellar basal body rod protein FlgF